MLTEGMDLLAQPDSKHGSPVFVTIAHYILATNLTIFDSGLALRLSLTLLLPEAYTHKANFSNDICKKGYLPSLILQSSPFGLQLLRHVRQTRRTRRCLCISIRVCSGERSTRWAAFLSARLIAPAAVLLSMAGPATKKAPAKRVVATTASSTSRPSCCALCEIQIDKDDDTPVANKKERHSLIPASQRERTGVAETRTIRVCALCKRVVHDRP
jgi:hypothetical protein